MFSVACFSIHDKNDLFSFPIRFLYSFTSLSDFFLASNLSPDVSVSIFPLFILEVEGFVKPPNPPKGFIGAELCDFVNPPNPPNGLVVVTVEALLDVTARGFLEDSLDRLTRIILRPARVSEDALEKVPASSSSSSCASTSSGLS